MFYSMDIYNIKEQISNIEESKERMKRVNIDLITKKMISQVKLLNNNYDLSIKQIINRI